MSKDPVMVDLDRYLDESEEGYVSPSEQKEAYEEYMADQYEYGGEE